MILHRETLGAGKPLALLHGWAMNSEVWNGLGDDLIQHSRVSLIDLPGHGRSAMTDSGFTLASLAALVAAQLEDTSIVIGWSLGGMVALQVALDYPQRVSKLVLISTSAQFVRSEDWPHGVDATLVQQLHQELQQDARATISRFLAIQALGSSAARDEIRLLQQQIFRHGEPDARALSDGLAILQTINLRPRLAEITCPVLLVNGEHDRLMPVPAAQAMLNELPNAQLTLIKSAGHAPFLSHPEEFRQTLMSFL